MVKLITFLILSLAMVYLAIQNTVPVSLHFGVYSVSGVPLYFVIIGSVLLGVLLAYLIYFINSIFLNLSIRKKNLKIKESGEENIDLTKQVHQLELENERIKNNSTTNEPTDKNAL